MLPIKLISTDFDGTLFAEFEDPPIPPRLEKLIGSLQAQGAKWVINTGRDLSSLMESLARARLSIRPDFLVLVEREIYYHENSSYLGLEDWNVACTRLHAELFERVRPDLPRIVDWIQKRFTATLYEDVYSPFCLIAGNTRDADDIYDFLVEYCVEVPGLTVVRNDVYARFSHVAYNKGSALAEIARRLEISPEHTVAAGDHYNDLPMLRNEHAKWLAAPANAVPTVKELIIRQNGYLSQKPHGHGIADCLEQILARHGLGNQLDLIDNLD